MRFLLLAAAVAVLAAGCGGHKRTSFTNANYAALVAHPARYGGAHVDVVGQVQGIARDEDGTEWLLVYVDVKHASWVTLVDLANASSAVGERQLVHLVGAVKPDLTVPFDFGGYEPAPIVLADTATTTTATR